MIEYALKYPEKLYGALGQHLVLVGVTLVLSLLLAAVLLIPPLEPLFQVAELSVGLVGCIVGLAFGSMVVIQVLKAIRSMGKK